MSDSDDFDNDDVLPTPIWNESEKTFFCTACTWEVVDGECCQCGLKHAWEEDSQRKLRHSSRQGFTPSRNNPVCVLTPKEYGDSIPMGYTPELYWALRQRGVSELESLPRTQSSTRRGNPNGTDFIESLIEDAVFYPCQEPESRRMYEAWETVMKSGVWLTRPRGSATQEENDWTSDQEDEHEWEDWVASAGEAGLAQDLALETGASLLPKPFMNDYHAESEYEESDTDEDQLVEGIEQVNLESSDEEVDELEDEEAAIQLLPDTIWEPSSGDEEDTTSDWTTEESEWEGSADSDAE
ncbi:hypothetical protein BJ165DRAFT_1407098 [Panaeolus papilionaceus]|nr:hypothetical protein BJ165DRAFT_1407098 [Panaeolus papilionaceus]